MAKKKSVRIGLIGAGGIARGRVRNLIDSDPCVDIAAAVEPNADNLAKIEEIVGKPIKRYPGVKDYRRMILDEDLDGVAIFSPHNVHYEQAKFALEHDKHVLIEKPMVYGVGPALETTQIAQERGLVYLICYQRHYQPIYIKARELIQGGRIGKLQGFYVYMAQQYNPAGMNWRGDPKQSCGGQINDSGSHYQDMLLWLTGLMPESVTGFIDPYFQGVKSRVELNGMFSLALAGGVKGRLIILGDYIGGFSDDVRFRGDKGVLIINGMKNELSIVEPGKKPKPVKCSAPRGYPADPSDNFVKLILGKTKENRVPAIFGAKVALLTEMLLTAAKTGKEATAAAVVKKSGYKLDDLV